MKSVEEMERTLGIDEKSRRQFENMMCGYFGLQSSDDLYELRGIVDTMRKFSERRLPRKGLITEREQ